MDQRKNNELIPRKIFKSSHKKLWFKCDVCNHEFNKTICGVSGSDSWCPYCVSKKLCNEENCDFCFNKSFASFDEKTQNGKLKIDCWIKNKNKGLLPRNIYKNTDKKYWFKCDVCNHEFDMQIMCIAGSTRSYWCSYCSNQRLCNNNDCKLCFNKSLRHIMRKPKMVN